MDEYSLHHAPSSVQFDFSTIVLPMDFTEAEFSLAKASWKTFMWGELVVRYHGMKGIYYGNVPIFYNFTYNRILIGPNFHIDFSSLVGVSVSAVLTL